MKPRISGVGGRVPLRRKSPRPTGSRRPRAAPGFPARAAGTAPTRLSSPWAGLRRQPVPDAPSAATTWIRTRAVRHRFARGRQVGSLIEVIEHEPDRALLRFSEIPFGMLNIFLSDSEGSGIGTVQSQHSPEVGSEENRNGDGSLRHAEPASLPHAVGRRPTPRPHRPCRLACGFGVTCVAVPVGTVATPRISTAMRASASSRWRLPSRTARSRPM